MSRSPVRCAERGPHPVGVVTAEIGDPAAPGRKLPIDLWYPADEALRGRDLEPDPPTPHAFGQPHRAIPSAGPAPGRWPLVVFSHGNRGLRQQSTFLTTQLASWGMVVAAPDHVGNTFSEMLGVDDPDEIRRRHLASREARPRDLLVAIDAAMDLSPEGPAIDAERIAVLGHSFGGWTAAKLPLLDPRVRAVCGLAPASEPFVGRRAFEKGELPFPAGVSSLLIAGRDDVLVDLETGVVPLYERLEAPSRLLVIDGADHFHFCDGIPLLHQAHVQNPRQNQPRPARPLDALLPETRMHRILRGLVTSYLCAVFGGAEDPVGELDVEHVSVLDPAITVAG